MAGASKLANKWKSVQGEDHWKGLLNPLDEELCKELIRYGQFVQSVYDSFNANTYSDALGFSRYGKSELFDKVYFKSGYTIHKFIYCTVLLESLVGQVVNALVTFTGPATSWFGYVSVSDDEKTKELGRRDIVVVFRGTQADLEWANNLLNTFKADIPLDLQHKAQSSESLSGLPPLDDESDENGNATTNGSASTVSETVTVEKRAQVFPSAAPKSLFGGLVATSRSTITGLVNTPFDTISAVTSIQFPWQKAVIGNRWLVPYTRNNPEDPNGFGKTSARRQVMEAISTLINRYKDEEISITVVGHSLGAAIATVCAYDIANEKKNVNPATGATIPVTAFTYASPAVGNNEFKEKAEATEGLRILRIANFLDLVPQVPPGLLGFVHVGKDFILNTLESRYIKPLPGIADHHNLQLYLHLIANKFGSLEHHQLALVNKSSDCLKDSIVPGNWWTVKNKDVFPDELGKWGLRTYSVTADNEEFN